MLFSVVIPTCNRPQFLAECLKRLNPEKQTIRGDYYEVIVSDDGDLDQQVGQMIAEKFHGVRWSEGPRRGPAANRNNGASQATGNVVVFLDDDCLPDEGLLEGYQTAFRQNPKLSAAEGKIVTDREARRLDEVAPVNVTGGLFWSCNVAVRKSVFDRMGGFDERFPYAVMEDVELRCRLRRLEGPPLFVPAASVVHPLRRLRGGWTSVKRTAAAHGLYVRIETTDMSPFTWRFALRRFARSWIKGILPSLWRSRGRGMWVRIQFSMMPLLCVGETRRAAKMPRLPSWTGDRGGWVK